MDDFVRRKHRRRRSGTSRDPSKTRPPSLWGRLKRRVKLAWSVSRPAIIELIHESWTRLTLSKMTSLVLAGLFVFFSPEHGRTAAERAAELSQYGVGAELGAWLAPMLLSVSLLWLPRRDASADALRGQVDLPDGGLQCSRTSAAVALRYARHPDVLGQLLGGHPFESASPSADFWLDHAYDGTTTALMLRSFWSLVLLSFAGEPLSVDWLGPFNFRGEWGAQTVAVNITSSWQILLYFLFLVISLVLLLNLLIAMMGDTYSDVRDESEVVCRWLFARRVLRMELLLKPFVSIDALRIGKRSHTHRERYHTITFDTYSKDVDDPFDPNPTKRELSEAETKGAAGVGSRRVPDEIDALAGSVGKNVAAQLRKAIAGGRIDLSEAGALSVRPRAFLSGQMGVASPSRPVPVQRDGSRR